MTVATHEKMQELLKDFDAAMLVTRSDEGSLRARPMALADVDDDGVLWFLTERGSAKVQEISEEHQVNVAMQSSNKFISISGTAAPVENRQKLDDIWNEAWKVWFPGGKSDPNLMLLRVDGDRGEYWDNSGLSGIKYIIEAGKAYLKGERPDVESDPKIHGKVEL